MSNNYYIHPVNSLGGRLFSSLCNSKYLKKTCRFIFNLLPEIHLESDISNVLYLNWLVDKEKVKELTPENVKLIDINGKTMLSILVYEHGHFRPSLANFAKRTFPSPLQSNWRLYVDAVNDEKL